MNKRNALIIIGLMGLIAAAFYVHRTRSGSTLDSSLAEFAVSDTASIDRIFLADRRGNTVLLDRKQVDHWELNEKHKARQDAVQLLLETIMKVEVKMPVPKVSHNNVVRLLAGTATKVEVYQKGELVRTYYVGDATTDHEGTYMIMEGKEVPYITHIPGFHGWLTPRYFTRVNEWRDTEVFRYPRLSEIAEVNITYHTDPAASFSLTRDTDGRYHLRPAGAKADLGPLDTSMVRMYMHEFSNIRFERAMDMEDAVRDSVIASQPYYTINVRHTNGETRNVTTWRIKALPGTYDIEDRPLQWDTDRMHAMLGDDRTQLVLVQYFVFDRIALHPSAFLKRPQ